MTTTGPVDRGRPVRRVVGTIVARNYVAYAQVLEQSVLSSNPDLDFVTLLVDGTDEDRDSSGLGAVALIDDLGLPAEEIEPMLVMYDVMELATAVKPAMLRMLLSRGYHSAAYLDPDIWVCADLTDVFEAAESHAIALTPHVLQPVPRDGLEVAERTIMHAGIFNLGFIAVGDGARDFLDWWHERLRTDAVVDFKNALFTDQRWIDWVPALWDCAVLRDPGLNIAYWNIHERPVVRAEDGTLLAAGAPVRFVHFSGFDATQPWILSKFTADHPRTLLADEPVLAELARCYADLLTSAGHAERRRVPYGLDELPGGPVLRREIRTVYRAALLGVLPLPDVPRHPVSDPESLRRWLADPVQVAPWTCLCPADLAVWHGSPPLQQSFPDPTGLDAAAFRQRLTSGSADETQDRAATADLTSAPVAPTAEWSVTAVGHPTPSCGVAALAGRIARELVADGVTAELAEPLDQARRTSTGAVAATRWRRVDHRGSVAPSSQAPRNVIVCVDADRLSGPHLAAVAEPAVERRIAVWLTQTPENVVHHRGYLDAFDEVWVVDSAVFDAVTQVSRRPVRLLAVPAEPLSPSSAEKGATPRVLLEVDACSVERAPLDWAVAATRRAFADRGATLEIRVRHGSPTPRAVEYLRHHADGDDSIELTGAGWGTAESAPDVLLAPEAAFSADLSRADAVSRGIPVVGPGTDVGAAADAVRRAVVQGPAESCRWPRDGRTPSELLRDPARRTVGSMRRPFPIDGPEPIHRAARAEAELAALRSTRTFRYTRLLRSLVSARRLSPSPVRRSTREKSW